MVFPASDVTMCASQHQVKTPVAKRPKLTHKQKRQVSANRQKRLQQGATGHQLQDLGDQQPGLVIGRFGKHADVETHSGQVYRCHMRRTIDSVVCGDKVRFRPGIHEDVAGIIELVEERQSLLTRPDFYDGVKPVAANIDQIFIVSAVLPSLSLNIIDRYLIAAEDVAISPVIVINKVELLSVDERRQLSDTLKTYEKIGYQVLQTSCKSTEGLQELGALLDNKISIFVGQSGVGKSSLVNQILPNASEAIGEVSSTSGLGQHTTTSAKLLHLPQGGDLIDSPGVREFALWHLADERVAWGFREFRDYLGGCKFRDCKHQKDPGCLLQQAVKKGDIHPERLHSYHRILTSMHENKPSRNKAP